MYECPYLGISLLMPFLKFSFILEIGKKKKPFTSGAFSLVGSSGFRPLCQQHELQRREVTAQQHIIIHSKLSQKRSQLLYPGDRSRRV